LFEYLEVGAHRGTTSSAQGVNSDGSVVQLAFHRTSVGGMQPLGTLGGTFDIGK
jgi:uncharacterized membrane protein